MKAKEKKIRLLFVDDEPKFLEVVAKRLGRGPFDVVTAANGRDAIRVARRGGFDVALVDLRMPDLDGEQAPDGYPYCGNLPRGVIRPAQAHDEIFFDARPTAEASV